MSTISYLLERSRACWDVADDLARVGRELHERNRLPEAEAVLRRVLQLDGEHEEAWAHLAFVNLRGYRPQEGLDLLREGIEATDSNRLRGLLAAFTPDAEEKAALLGAASDDEEPAVRIQVASVRVWDGDGDAFDEIDRLHDEHPGDARVWETWSWTQLGAKARGLRPDLDLHEQAIPAADRARDRWPERVFPHWMKTQMLLHEQDWSALLDATAEALVDFPDDETIMNLRAKAFAETGDSDRAVEWFSRAIGAKATYAGARIELAKLHEAAGREELAEELFREVLVANPDFAGGPLALAAFLGRHDRWDEAERVFLDTWEATDAALRPRLLGHPDAAALIERDAVKQRVAVDG